jgi:hypothetical protein
MRNARVWLKWWTGVSAVEVLTLLAVSSALAQTPHRVVVNWGQVEQVSKTTPTLQVVVNPPLRRGSPIHNRVFEALHNLGADYVRYVPWLPYPKLAVAELEPPANGKTSWDFSLIDPMMEDFMNATAGHSVIINFSTIPEWMWKTPKPVPYPSNPDQVDWHYEQGTQLVDPSMKQVADYYARLVSWYTKGGFTDEYGHKHTSGHHYEIQYWEVLNEINGEHQMSAPFYTALYDKIVAAIRGVDPKMKFVGMAYGGTDAAFFQYFLDHHHHQPGIPLNMISYHFYAGPTAGQDLNDWQYTFFDQADHFLDVVRYIQVMRQRLSPETQTDTDELGCILPYDTADHLIRKIPNGYWNLCGAMYAYLYAGLAHQGIEVAGESQLVGYPTQFPGVSMVDWVSGQPNARFWVLKLLHDNFGLGDKLVKTEGGSEDVYAQGFVTPSGQHKLLLINKRNRPAVISLSGAAGSTERYVDEDTAESGLGTARLTENETALGPFEVSVVNLSKSKR